MIWWRAEWLLFDRHGLAPKRTSYRAMRLWCVMQSCGMPWLDIIAVALTLAVVAPSNAQDASPTYDFRDRTRALAFDPSRFFSGGTEPVMSIRYKGDDFGYPVYAIAVQKGCTDADLGELHRTCGGRLIARMIRSPYEGEPARPRARGQRLLNVIAQAKPQSDDALRQLLDITAIEWLEADIRKCPTAMTHLATGRDLQFSSFFDQSGDLEDIVLHADTVSFEISDYLMRSRYEGWLSRAAPPLGRTSSPAA